MSLVIIISGLTCTCTDPLLCCPMEPRSPPFRLTPGIRYRRDQAPDFGLYLDPQWDPPWSHDHLDLPDSGVPSDSVPVVAALRSLLERLPWWRPS